MTSKKKQIKLGFSLRGQDIMWRLGGTRTRLQMRA